MKCIATYKGYTLHNGIVRPIIDTQFEYLRTLADLEENKEYSIEIKKVTKKRSLQQNAYLWALIGEISEYENGDLRDEDNLYKNLIKMSGAKTDTLIIKTEAVKSFTSNFRAYEILNEEVVKGESWSTIRVFYGSSKLDTKEMTNLIDTTLKYAAEIGIETSYWKELLKC